MNKIFSKTGFVLFALFAVLIGLYPLLYSSGDMNLGLLASKAEALKATPHWRAAFYTHITFGGLALLVGWLQFSKKVRQRRVGLHRKVGYVYLVSVLLSGLGGFVLALYANEGWAAGAGFMGLSLIWLFTTLRGFRAIRQGRTRLHGVWMALSYAATFAAVTLRLEMPLLTLLLADPGLAYIAVAWLCWVPNLLVVGLYQRRKMAAA